MAIEKKGVGEKTDNLIEKVGEMAKDAVKDAKETVHDVKAKTERAWDKLTKNN